MFIKIKIILKLPVYWLVEILVAVQIQQIQNRTDQNAVQG
jgi:hypothetical protein